MYPGHTLQVVEEMNVRVLIKGNWNEKGLVVLFIFLLATTSRSLD